MKLIKATGVDAALRTLSTDDRRQALVWFDHLQNWETDELVRRMAKPMVYHDTYSLTADDLRIFFTLNETKREIVVMDLAKPSRFQTAVAVSE